MPAPEGREVNTLIANAVGRIRQLVGAKGGVSVRLAPQPMVIPGDAGDVDRVLLDLVLNAREALNGGGGVITIETHLHESLTVSVAGVSRKGPYIRLTVGDSGPGGPGEAGVEPSAETIVADEAAVDARLASVVLIVHRLGGVLQIQRRGPRTRTSVYLPLTPDRRLKPPHRC
jgi:nitrogen-specific signal transduction histidine kinase